MAERQGAITMKGDPLTLVGDEIQEGQPAPQFTVRGQDLKPIRLSDYQGKVVILVTVPSLDTPTCDTEARKFNEAATKLGDDVEVLTVSMDLPFAQKRWCGDTGSENLTTGSDYYDHSFGQTYGLRIKELGVLARAVIVIDKEGKVRHYQLVKEVSEEPDYDAAIDAAKEAAG